MVDMVIKRFPGGESAGGGRSTSKSTCVVPAWALTAFGDRPASSISKFSASVNSVSDLGNGSFCVEIGDAEPVDRCRWKYTRVWSYQLTIWPQEMFTFWICFAMVVSESSFGAYVCLRRPAGLHRDERFCGSHDGHYKALSRCWLVGSCVLPGENIFRPKTTFARLTVTFTGNLAVKSVFITIRSMRDTNKFHFFFFIFRNFFAVSFTMVIKRSPGGESAGGRRGQLQNPPV